MRKNPVPLFSLLMACILLVFLTTACKKEKGTESAIAGWKMELQSGGGQTDTVGNFLKDPVRFKVIHYRGARWFRYDTYDCDNNVVLASEEYDPDGTSDSVSYSFFWQLNGIVGTQYLKVIILDSLKQALDSITVTATALKASEKGWHRSGCSPPRWAYSQAFAQLPSGRMLTANTGTGVFLSSSLYFSDDEGITWFALNTLPANLAIQNIFTTPANEVFLGTYSKGVFYSKDGGLTWENRTGGLPTKFFDGNISYTKSGKLFYSYMSTAYLSSDKGLTWHGIADTYSYSAFSNAVSLTDGTLFAKFDGVPCSSTDGGDHWTRLWTLNAATIITAVFVDDNDNMYVGCTNGPSGDGLYVSKDRGQTWNYIYSTKSYNATEKGVYQITKSNGGYYFYASNQHQLIRTTDFVTFINVSPPPYISYRSENFFVTKDDHLILSFEQEGFQYFIP